MVESKQVVLEVETSLLKKRSFPNLPEPWPRPEPMNRTGAGKKKKFSGRKWLALSIDGQSQILDCEKRTIMRRTSIPARDLRLLGPLFSDSAAILGRERAVIVSLEQVKAIITADEVLVLDPTADIVSPFIKKLELMIEALNRNTAALLNHTQTETPASTEPSSYSQTNSMPPGLVSKRFKGFKLHAAKKMKLSEATFPFLSKNPLHRLKFAKKDRTEGKNGVEMNTSNHLTALEQKLNEEDLDVLPFEFRVLEIALETSLSFLENEAKQLLSDAKPALDELTRHVSTSVLEKVRNVKSRLTRITARVQKVRDELEHLLDDDEDMSELYLTRQIHRGSVDSPIAASSAYTRRNSYRLGSSVDYQTSVGGLDVVELEMLLETYFMQVDGTLNKLITLREYIDDTEDFVNIELDNNRNQLIQMKLCIFAFVFSLTIIMLGAGICGMNFPLGRIAQTKVFGWYVSAIVLVAVLVFAGFVFYARRNQLIGV